MSKKYDAILFDFDFTLVDASEGIEHCLKLAFNDMSLEFNSPGMEEYTQGITMIEFIERHSDVKDHEVHEQILLKYREFADGVMTDMTRVFDDTHSGLLHLKDSGYKLGVVSNKYRFRIEEYLERKNYIHLFDTIIGMEDMENPKPAPDGLLMAMDNIGTSPERSLFVGDNPIDARTAQNAGTDFVGISRFGHRHFESAEIEFLAIINSLEELKSHL